MARSATHRTYATRLPAAERRRQLLQAAGRVLAHGGYPALTMEAVARQAGVTKPVVYAAFANREDLMARLLEAEGQRVVAEITAAISPPPGQHTSDDLGELMVAGLRRVLELVSRRPQRYRLILLHVDGSPEPVREAVTAGRHAVAAHVRQTLERVIPGSEFDTELLALMLVGIGEHSVTLLLSDPQRFAPARFEATIRHLLPVPSPAISGARSPVPLRRGSARSSTRSPSSAPASKPRSVTASQTLGKLKVRTTNPVLSPGNKVDGYLCAE